MPGSTPFRATTGAPTRRIHANSVRGLFGPRPSAKKFSSTLRTGGLRGGRLGRTAWGARGASTSQTTGVGRASGNPDGRDEIRWM